VTRALAEAAAAVVARTAAAVEAQTAAAAAAATTGRALVLRDSVRCGAAAPVWGSGLLLDSRLPERYAVPRHAP
jgi:hypothetical protein